jgi:hypothetical protein
MRARILLVRISRIETALKFRTRSPPPGNVNTLDLVRSFQLMIEAAPMKSINLLPPTPNQAYETPALSYRTQAMAMIPRLVMIWRWRWRWRYPTPNLARQQEIEAYQIYFRMHRYPYPYDGQRNCWSSFRKIARWTTNDGTAPTLSTIMATRKSSLLPPVATSLQDQGSPLAPPSLKQTCGKYKGIYIVRCVEQRRCSI